MYNNFNNIPNYLKLNSEIDFTYEYSIQRDGVGLEWGKCPSATELKYISKAEKLEYCSSDECLTSSLLKCCNKSKAYIQLGNIYYDIENDEYCIWPTGSRNKG